MNVAPCGCSSTTTCSSSRPQIPRLQATPIRRTCSSFHLPAAPLSFPAPLVAPRNPSPSPLPVVLGDAEETSPATSLSDGSFTRRLVLLRHADSSWEDPSLRDHDRPLSKVGRDDAVIVSHNLERLGWVPELILCSDAFRTRETLSIMQQEVESFIEAEVHFVSSFYSVAAMDGQTAEHLQKIICQFSRDDTLTVMCMGHNKGWQEAATMLSGIPIELKTCHAALLQAPGRSWEEAFSSAGFGGWKVHAVVGPNAHH